MATIVVADDDAAMQMLLSRGLEMRGHRIWIASDGIEALELVRQHAPDLLIADANMPQMGGIEAITALRAEGNSTPAVLITADSGEGLVQSLDDNTRFLAKPFSPPQLIAFVTRTLQSSSTPEI